MTFRGLSLHCTNAALFRILETLKVLIFRNGLGIYLGMRINQVEEVASSSISGMEYCLLVC